MAQHDRGTFLILLANQRLHFSGEIYIYMEWERR
jgi:hypothetical protein